MLQIVLAVRTTEADDAKYWWVYALVGLIIALAAVKFYVDKIKRK